MTRTSFLLLPLLAASAGGAAPAPAADAATAAPRLVVEAMEIDAGSVPQGETVEGVFVIRNEGEAALAILSAKPG